MTKGTRVFRDELGEWPEVYQTGPKSFEVVAKHDTPGAIHTINKWSLLVPLALPFILLPRISPDNWGFIIIGIVGGGALLLWAVRRFLSGVQFLTERSTRVLFNNGAIEWGKKDGHTIPAGMERVFRTARHRAAAAEARDDQKLQQKPPPLYQTSSEVFIDTGPGRMHARRVAQIANDENLETGHALAATLRFVDEQTRSDIQRAEARTRNRVSFD